MYTFLAFISLSLWNYDTGHILKHCCSLWGRSAFQISFPTTNQSGVNLSLELGYFMHNSMAIIAVFIIVQTLQLPERYWHLREYITSPKGFYSPALRNTCHKAVIVTTISAVQHNNLFAKGKWAEILGIIWFFFFVQCKSCPRPLRKLANRGGKITIIKHVDFKP